MPRLVVSLVALLALGFGVYEAIDQWWTCDDAYIHFRYSENLAHGKGLVYNEGEYVEGYLTVLWNLILAGAIWLGWDPLWFGNAFGIGCFVLVLGLLVAVALRTRARDGTVVPIAAVLYALHGHAQVFATSGMETSLFTLLATAMACQLIQAATSRDYFVVGLLGVLATLTRVDGAMFCLGALPIVLASAWQRRSWSLVLAFCAPTLLIYLPYFLIRWDYYGWPMPNLFYAKSAARAYVSQGWFYVWIFFRCYYVMIGGLFALVALLITRLGKTPITQTGFTAFRAPLVLCAFVLPFLAYIIWVGGDFMFGRFVIPLVPALFLGIQLLVPKLTKNWLLYTLCLLCIVGMRLRIYPEQIRTKHGYHGVTEEPWFYKTHARYMGAVGGALAELTKDTDTRVLVGSGQAALGYFGKFRTVIEKNGLTDEFIAHQTLPTRGRVAHERAHLTPRTYFTHRRQVNFFFDTDPGPMIELPDAIGKARWCRFRLLGIEQTSEWATMTPAQRDQIAWIKGYMMIYKTELMDELATRPGIEFSKFPDVLDRYLERARHGEIEKTQIAKDLKDFKDFYFDHNDDPARQTELEALSR